MSTRLDPDIMNKVRHILLQHRGRDNAIKASAIRKKLGWPRDDTNAVVRAHITAILKEDGIPIAAYNGGFFIADTQEEHDDYILSLEDRISGVEDRIEAFSHAWKNRTT